MDLDELRAFVAAVDTGSIVAAARSLDFARATLRRRLDDLEARAGVPLLHRTAQGVTPTEAGAVLAARGRRILEDASGLLSAVREVGADPAGELRVVLPVGLPPQVVTRLFVSLRGKHPGLSLRVDHADEPLRGLLDGVDVVGYFGVRAPAGAWVSHQMLHVQERLVASRDYLARRGTPAAPEDLRGHDLLAWDAPDVDPTAWPVHDGTIVAVTPQVVSTDIHLLRQCTAAGMGIAFLPTAAIAEADDADDLVPVLPDTVGRERPLSVVVPAALADIPRIRALLTEVQEFLTPGASG